jgi:type I restriction enzyme M protein
VSNVQDFTFYLQNVTGPGWIWPIKFAASPDDTAGERQAALIRRQIDLREEDEVGRLQAEYQAYADRLVALDTEIAVVRAKREAAKTKGDRTAAETVLTKLEKPCEKLAAKLAERDERIAEARRRAKEDRQDVDKVGDELVALYAYPDELLKHARVVCLDEIEENEFNLNIPRYVDTFEPEPRIEVNMALKALAAAENAEEEAERTLYRLLKRVGYAAD